MNLIVCPFASIGMEVGFSVQIVYLPVYLFEMKFICIRLLLLLFLLCRHVSLWLLPGVQSDVENTEREMIQKCRKIFAHKTCIMVSNASCSARSRFICPLTTELLVNIQCKSDSLLDAHQHRFYFPYHSFDCTSTCMAFFFLSTYPICVANHFTLQPFCNLFRMTELQNVVNIGASNVASIYSNLNHFDFHLLFKSPFSERLCKKKQAIRLIYEWKENERN